MSQEKNKNKFETKQNKLLSWNINKSKPVVYFICVIKILHMVKCTLSVLGGKRRSISKKEKSSWPSWEACLRRAADTWILMLSFFNLILFYYFFICSEFCHTLKWNSHGFTCVPHPDPPSHLPLHPISLGLPSVPGLSACLVHPTWAGDLFHPR